MNIKVHKSWYAWLVALSEELLEFGIDGKINMDKNWDWYKMGTMGIIVLVPLFNSML